MSHMLLVYKELKELFEEKNLSTQVVYKVCVLSHLLVPPLLTS